MLPIRDRNRVCTPFGSVITKSCMLCGQSLSVKPSALLSPAPFGACLCGHLKRECEVVNANGTRVSRISNQPPAQLQPQNPLTT